MSINVVLLAGGAGARLWPLSNTEQPKQFIILPLVDASPFQLALKRAISLSESNKLIIVTNKIYQEILKQQIKDIDLNYNDFSIIFEQNSNNTGMAVYQACCFLLQNNQDHITYFFPTDHFISEPDDFFFDVIKEIDLNKINLFAEKVTTICSNFGYLIRGTRINNNYYAVDKFIEKPNFQQIQEIERYNFIYKNLGIYLSKPSILYQEFLRFYDDLPVCKFKQEVNQYIVEVSYNKLPIDKMIAEKSSLLNMYAINFPWQDIGSYQSLYQYCPDGLISCNIASEDILSFNEDQQEYNLQTIDDKIRIIKK